MTGDGPQSLGAGPAYGVVGVGSLGRHHARILASLPGIRLAGLLDLDAARAQAVATQHGTQAFATLDAMLDAVEAVVIATPTSSHEEVALAALAAGAHVFVEKPIAPSLDAADRILEAAEAAGRVVQVGHVERFNGALRAARSYLDTPLFIESHRLAPFVPRSTDVAVVLDLMIHDVDLVRALVDRPIESIAATGVPVITPTVDIANARLGFEGGAVANLTASRISMERMRKLRVFQRSGYLSLDLAAGRGEFLRLRETLPAFGGSDQDLAAVLEEGGYEKLIERIPIEGDGAEPLYKELESFRDAVAGIAPPAVSGQDGRDALEVTLAIEQLIQAHVADTRTA